MMHPQNNGFKREITSEMNGHSEEKPSETPEIGGDKNLPSEELRRLWRQFRQTAAKTKSHDRIVRLVGNWSMQGEFDACGYGPHYDCQGSVVGTPVFSGRFVQLEWAITSALDSWTLRFLLGYDPIIDKYTTIMIESLHNGMMVGEAEWREEDQTLRFWGEISNPMFRTRHDCLMVFQFEDDDSVVVTMNVPDREGKFQETSRFELTREA